MRSAVLMIEAQRTHILEVFGFVVFKACFLNQLWIPQQSGIWGI